MENKLSIGEKVKQIRYTIKLSQKDFSSALGIKPPYLSEIEHNKKEITSKLLLVLNEKFNISIDWLLFSSENYESNNLNDNGYFLSLASTKTTNTENEGYCISDKEIISRINDLYNNLDNVYHRIIDVKLIYNKLTLGTEKEETGLSNFIDRLADIKAKYVSDQLGADVFDFDDPTLKFENVIEMTSNEKYNYLLHLEKDYASFYKFFFSIFGEFYKKYRALK